MVMSKIISSQIDNQNFASMARRESAAVDSTASLSNKGSEQNLIARTGAATLADFVVALVRNGVHIFARVSRNQTQGRLLQLIKILS